MGLVTVTGFTAARMQAIEDATIVSADVVNNELILTRHDNTTVNCGPVFEFNAGSRLTWTGGSSIGYTTTGPESVVTAAPGSLTMKNDGSLWIKRTGSGNTGWKNGATTDICTSSTRPTSPLVGHRIYETDTGNTLLYYGATSQWMKEWDKPWGRVSFTEVTTDIAINVSITSLISSSSITLRQDRLYLVHFFAQLSSYGAGAAMTVQLYFHENTTNRATLGSIIIGTTDRYTFARTLHYSPATTNTNIHRLRADSSASGATFAGTVAYGQMIIEDIGPNGNPPAS